MVEGADGNKRKIFCRKPTVFADNKACVWIGKNGFSSLGTMARNSLVNEIDKKYLHYDKHAPGDPRSNCSCERL